MSVWSFPATVGDVLSATVFTAEIDLGLRHYHPCAVRVASVRPRNRARLQQLLRTGDRVTLTTAHLSASHEPVPAHVTLHDGRDLAHALRSVDHQLEHPTRYGTCGDRVWRYPAHPTTVIDGDTLRARVDIGIPTRLINEIRVEHVDAWEEREPGGPAATDYAVAHFPTGVPVTVTSRKLEKYGRILGSITLPDGADYATGLLNAGHATPYEP